LKLTLKQNFCEFDSLLSRKVYAKTVHQEYSNLHELHPITSAREFEGALKASPMRPGAEPRKL